MFNSNSPSLSDIAAVTGRNNDGFGDGNGWWILIILFAIFGGWGNRGWGGTGDNGSMSPTNGYVLATDFATLERKIDGVNNGLCDGFYAMNTGMLNGFNAVNTNVAAGFAGVNNAVCTLGYQNAQLINGVNTSLMQSTNTLQAQLNDCCCENRAAIAQVRYDMATNACATNNAINQAAQNIMQNCNNNYRSLHDEMVQFKLDSKDEKIAERDAIIAELRLAASQAAQNNYLIGQLRPAAVPAYNVPNPYNGYGFQCCNAVNNGCC